MRVPAQFVHLHVHSGDSLRRGMMSSRQIAKVADDFRMTAVALTDHAMLSSVWDFELAALQRGVKPIYGAEIAVMSRGYPSHVTLLAETETGYRNLVQIVSQSHVGSRAGEPVIDVQFLRDHCQGVIALSGCLEGEVAGALLRGASATAERVAMEYYEIFGSGNYYLELMDNGMPEQRNVNRMLADLSRRLAIPIVATANCRYLRIADRETYQVKTRIHPDGTGSAPSPHGLYHFRTAEEMGEAFGELPTALSNTMRIAERCSVMLPAVVLEMPCPPSLQDIPRKERLPRLARDGFERVVRSLTPEARLVYEERYRQELQVIEATEYGDYLVLAWDIIREAKAQGSAVGPGRGSLPSSLVAFCLGLTDIDPIIHGLLFERYLHPELSRSRSTILFDFDLEGREKLLEYLARTYGFVAGMLEFERLKGPELLMKVAHALEVPEEAVTALPQIAPEAFKNNSIPGQPEREDHPRLASFLENNSAVARVLDTAAALNGMKNRIAPEVERYVVGKDYPEGLLPLCRDGVGAILTQADSWTFTQQCVPHFVFGAMPLLSVMKRLERQLLTGRDGGHHPQTLEEIPLDDPATYALISAGNLETADPHWPRRDDDLAWIARGLEPSRLEDVAALYALCRPGPMSKGMVDAFLSHTLKGPGGEPIPIVDEVLRETRGLLIYQEQITNVLHLFAGLTIEDAERLRVRLCTGALVRSNDSQRQPYMEKVALLGIDPGEAERVYDWLKEYAGLTFMKAHALAYAVLMVRGAHLKCHFGQEFLAAWTNQP